MIVYCGTPTLIKIGMLPSKYVVRKAMIGPTLFVLITRTARHPSLLIVMHDKSVSQKDISLATAKMSHQSACKLGFKLPLMLGQAKSNKMPMALGMMYTGPYNHSYQLTASWDPDFERRCNLSIYYTSCPVPPGILVSNLGKGPLKPAACRSPLPSHQVVYSPPQMRLGCSAIKAPLEELLPHHLSHQLSNQESWYQSKRGKGPHKPLACRAPVPSPQVMNSLPQVELGCGAIKITNR